MPTTIYTRQHTLQQTQPHSSTHNKAYMLNRSLCVSFMLMSTSGAAPEMLVDALKSWVPGGGALRAPALAEAPPTPPMFGPYAIADAAAKV